MQKTQGEFYLPQPRASLGLRGHSHESCVPWVSIYVRLDFCLMNIYQEMSGQDGSV